MVMQDMKNLSDMVDHSDLLNKPEELQRVAAAEGYLHFKQLIPKDTLLNVRQDICDILHDFGCLNPDAKRLDAIVHPDMDLTEDFLSHSKYQTYYNTVLKCQSFHQLALHPNIMSMLKTLFGETVLAHSRNILRTIMPGDCKFTTPPHQDYLHIQGSVNTWTLWMPLGDCPVELGGLAVAPGTHIGGLMEHVGAYGAGGAGVELHDDQDWVGNDMKIGDVILLNCHTVHQGRNNTIPDQIRLSCDFRYQPLSEPVVGASLHPHMTSCSWEDLYADWDDDDPVKYYWKKLEINEVEFQDMHPES
ncbi:phytanoyl-CoA dioxygenase family protein [bacterium AH-315-E10]|nr:phytanoyl-CoA dioxygenase family protein [bacterium AH-315-E10]